jgi:PKHD-type hydroxylase
LLNYAQLNKEEFMSIPVKKFKNGELVDHQSFLQIKNIVSSIDASYYQNDNIRFNRKFVNNYQGLRETHSKLANYISKKYNLNIVPTYNFISEYHKGAGVCKSHKDRSDCRYTLAICINNVNDWKLVVGEEEFYLDTGDCILYSGTEQEHSRPDMVEGQECTMLLFHFNDRYSPSHQPIIFDDDSIVRPDYKVFANFFTGKECEEIVEMAERLGFLNSHTSGKNDFRKSKTCWIYNTAESNWIVQRLCSALSAVNNSSFQMSIKTACLDLQVIKYEVGDNYGWHKDIGQGDNSLRKLSAVILLSKTNEFSGGSFEFLTEKQPILDQGSILVFPAYEYHRVNQVLSGVRYVLSTWAVGDPLR